MQGTTITKTILYNDNEYISIENYSIYDNDSTFLKVSYYVFGAENLIELSDDVISLRSSKQYQSDSWKIVREKEEEWEISVKKLDNTRLELIKNSSRLEEEQILQRTNISKQLSKTITLIIEYENVLYLTIVSSTFSNNREIFRTELVSDRDANSIEIEKFNRYKNILKQ